MNQLEKSELKIALKEVLMENKPLLKELIKELIDESAPLKEETRDEKVLRLINEDLVRYKKVWEALA